MPTLRAIVPGSARRWLRQTLAYPAVYYRLWANYQYDRRRFLHWSSVGRLQLSQAQLRSWIQADCHKIEKALALKEPRPGFGKAVVERLTSNLEQYLERGQTDTVTRTARTVLDSYVRFNRSHGVASETVESRIAKLDLGSGANGGVQHVTREAILADAVMDLERFFFSRHSIRHFADAEVDEALIERAVFLASNTPTVCNRQSLKVYCYSEPQDRKRVLACQMGNSGFGDQVKIALVVTSDVGTFFSIGERNQGWIDGGLFSMSLVYALHSLGLGSCCLNWSVEKERDRQLRSVTGIAESEMIIMMIGVGALPKSLRVAESPRKPVTSLLVQGKTRPVDG